MPDHVEPMSSDFITAALPIAPTIQFHGASNKVFLTITPEGKIILGPGLSLDEATQGAARLLAEYFEKYVRQFDNGHKLKEIVDRAP